MMAICTQTQSQLKASLVLYLKNNYPEVVVKEKYIYAEGAIPIALVAHLDTVHVQLPYQIYFDSDRNVMWSPQGLGADDRAGVAAIISIIESGYLPSVIFTLDEEKTADGAVGLSKIEMPFSKLLMVIELDRQGKNDSVFYNCDNPVFEDYINQFGFKSALGSFTDIKLFAPAWNVAAVNLSIGYEHEHTLGEILHVDWAEKTINRVINLFEDVLENNKGEVYEYIPRLNIFPLEDSDNGLWYNDFDAYNS